MCCGLLKTLTVTYDARPVCTKLWHGLAAEKAQLGVKY